MAKEKESEKRGDGEAKTYSGLRFKVRTPNRTLTRVHVCGIRFNNGEGATDNAAAAEHCVGCGYEVTDQQSGKVFNPLDAAEKK